MIGSYLFFGILTIILAGCKQNEVTIKINSKFQGYIYLISTNLKSSKDTIEIDKNGVGYLPDYCDEGITINFTVDNKQIKREYSYVTNHDFYSDDYEVSYQTFYFPFYPRQRFDIEPVRIETLVKQGKLDKTVLKRCKTK